ncbi:MAG: HAMP domain-containing histidine kinase, partial [Anaerolineae bacterium]|nr:HAMP domain-containing histidine kinase [Anaerolineae bacterium]
LVRNQTDVPRALIGELSEDIVQQVDQMSRQIDDLALLSQALNSTIDVHPETVSLADLSDEAVRQVRVAAEAKALTIAVDVDPATPPVYADARRVSQIIGNLLSNAVKFSPRGGRIDIAIQPVTAPGCPPQVELSVRDMGPGIGPADQAHIFDYFFRSPEQRPLQEGMGLGLAIAAQLAAAQGGTLRVESEPGAGATFILRLPRQPHTS